MAQIFITNLAIWKINKPEHVYSIKCEPNFLTFKNNKAVTKSQTLNKNRSSHLQCC